MRFGFFRRSRQTGLGSGEIRDDPVTPCSSVQANAFCERADLPSASRCAASCSNMEEVEGEASPYSRDVNISTKIMEVVTLHDIPSYSNLRSAQIDLDHVFSSLQWTVMWLQQLRHISSKRRIHQTRNLRRTKNKWVVKVLFPRLQLSSRARKAEFAIRL